MFTTALFIVIQNETNVHAKSTDEWINILWYSHGLLSKKKKKKQEQTFDTCSKEPENKTKQKKATHAI